MGIEVRSAVWTYLARVVACSGMLVAATASADPVLPVSGRTLACFGDACGTQAAIAVASASGMAFSGVRRFDLGVDASGVTTVTLGTFERGRDRVSSDAPALSFTIDVLLSPIGGYSNDQAISITGSIVGTTPGGGGPVSIDFDNTWHRLSTAAGALEFAILSDLEINKNGTATVIGGVRNVADIGSMAASVPEPAALALVGLGLLGLATTWRRRQVGYRAPIREEKQR